MKKFLLVILLVLIVFAVLNKQRLYVRDPLANVTRAGVAEDGAQVFINFANDVLLENDNPPRYVTLIQHNEPIGVPSKIGCLHWLVCMTESEHPILLGPVAPADSMTNKVVTFRDSDGRDAVVKLR